MRQPVIPIVWTRTTTSVKGSAWRKLHCETCNQEYVFQVKATARAAETALYGIGSGGANERTRRHANANQRRLLQHIVEPVPCPICGWYQADMCDEIKRRRYGWLLHMSICLIVIGGFADLIMTPS